MFIIYNYNIKNSAGCALRATLAGNFQHARRGGQTAGRAAQADHGADSNFEIGGKLLERKAAEHEQAAAVRGQRIQERQDLAAQDEPEQAGIQDLDRHRRQ